MKTIVINKKASFNYNIDEKYEAGLDLSGSEVKSLRNSMISITESYIAEKNSELWLFNCHINKYKSSSEKKYNPTKKRKILLKKKEQLKIIGSTNKNGFSAIPISLFFNKNGFAKVLIGLGKGKKKYDKREKIKKNEWNRQKQRLLKSKNQ